MENHPFNMKIFTLPSGYDEQFAMENPLMLARGKPSISMGHGFHGYVTNNQRVIYPFSLSVQGFLTATFDNHRVTQICGSSHFKIGSRAIYVSIGGCNLVTKKIRWIVASLVALECLLLNFCQKLNLFYMKIHRERWNIGFRDILLIGSSQDTQRKGFAQGFGV